MTVQITSDADVQKLLEENEFAIINFFAGWCGSCRMTAPKYKRLSDEAAFSHVTFFKLNSEQHPEFREKIGVNQLPYFAVFKNGKLIEGLATSREDKIVELLEKLQ